MAKMGTQAVKLPKVNDDIIKKTKGFGDSAVAGTQAPPSGVAARDMINSYGAQYGIKNDMIGFNKSGPNSNGMITLGGQDFMAPDSIVGGKSFVDNDKLRAAIDQYGASLKSQQQPPAAISATPQQPTFNANLSNHGYKDQYSAKIDGLLDSILNKKPFQYDQNTDPSFQAYQQQYGRLGDRALANTMSEASSLTGGRLNSWAVSAGQGAKSQYDQQLMDVIPQLEQAAYSRYQNETANQRANLGMISDLDNRNYSRANDNRNFAYGEHRDGIADTRYTDETKYNRGRDALADTRYTDETKYNRGQDTIANAHNDRVYTASNNQRYFDNTLNTKKFDYEKEQDLYKKAQDKLLREDNLREAANDNARQWANVQISREQLGLSKEKWAADKKLLDEASKKVEMPDILGETYSLMMKGQRIDSSGRLIAQNLSPSEWLKQEAGNLPADVLKELRKIVNEDTELSYKNPSYMLNSLAEQKKEEKKEEKKKSGKN